MSDYPFLKGGGEMGELTRKFNWSKTSLGSPLQWPVSLRTLAGMVLTSKFPMLLVWGKELLTLYNDAFRSGLGNDGKHPSSLGQPAEAVWAESWPVIGPLIHNILLGGDPVLNEDQRLPIYREGKTDYAYWTYSFSPVMDDAGEIGGVLVTCADTTKAVENLQLLNNANHHLEHTMEQNQALQKARQEADAQFIHVANTSPTGLWLSDKTGGLIYLNKTLTDWTGMPYQNLLGAGWADAIIEEDRQRAVEAFLGAIATLSHYDVQFRITKYDGSIIWCRAAGDPYYREDNSYAGYSGFCMDIDESVTMQQWLEKSRQQLLGLFEQSPVAIAIIEKENLTFRMANPFYGKLVNRRVDDIIDKPLLQALPELAGQGFDTLLNEVISSGKPFIASEFPVDIIKDGSIQTIYVEFAYQPMREPDNTISGVLVVVTDVSGQVYTRREIEKSEERFRSLIKEAPVATCLFVGRELRIVVANEIMKGYWGKGDTVMNKRLEDALPELKGQPFLDLLDEVFTTGKTYSAIGAVAQLEVNGTIGTYNFDYTYKPLRNTQGEVYAIIDMAIDVTARVSSQKKLEESEANLRNAINSAELGVYEINPETDSINANARFHEVFGSEPHMSWNDVVKIIHPDDKPVRDIALETSLHTGQLDYEVRIIKKDNTVHWIRVAGKILHHGKGRKIIGVVQDITEQKHFSAELERKVTERTQELEQANIQLQHSNAELNQFAYIASHDLQEPLRKVRTYTGLLESTLPEASDQTKDYLRRIENSSGRMQNLIQDVLSFSDLTKLSDRFEQVDLDKVIRSVLTDYDLLIEQSGALVTVHPLPVVEAIPLQMNQLFTNLLSNSLKFIQTERRPVISVTSRLLSAEETGWQTGLRKDKPYHAIEFTDNGIGFEQEYANRIFIIFQRLHGRSEYRGTGIGLALCKKIVLNHHGIIYAQSQIGHGATFTIILPELQR